MPGAKGVPQVADVAVYSPRQPLRRKVRMNVATLCRCVGSATLLGIVVACSNTPTTPAADSTPTFALAISGTDLIAVVGSTATLTATMTQGGQTTDVTSSARWVSDDTSAVALDGPGRIRAVAPGAAQATSYFK